MRLRKALEFVLGIFAFMSLMFGILFLFASMGSNLKFDLLALALLHVLIGLILCLIAMKISEPDEVQKR